MLNINKKFIKYNKFCEYINQIKLINGRICKLDYTRSFLSNLEFKNKLIVLNFLNNSNIYNLNSIRFNTIIKNKNFNENKNSEIEDIFASLNDIMKIQGNNSENIKLEKIRYIIDKYISNQNEYSILKDILFRTLTTGLSSKSLGIIVNELYEQKNIDINEFKLIQRDIIKYNINPSIYDINLPIRSMLAKTMDSIEDFQKFNNKMKSNIYVEHKYDGERIQLHWEDKQINLFSRNFENLNEKFSFLRDNLYKSLLESEISQITLDCEIIPYDFQNNKILPFIEVTKKNNENIKLIVFDILYYNNQNLLIKDLFYRKNILNKLNFDSKYLNIIEYKYLKYEEISDNLENIYNISKENNNEGLMIKLDNKDSLYVGDNRKYWCKLKFLDKGWNESLDLILIGAYYGKGNRKNLYGSFLMAVHNSEDNQYYPITKLGTGFSKELLLYFHDILENTKISKNEKFKLKGFNPDVLFEPKFVWEIGFDSFSKSQIYSITKKELNSDKGISLRFPYFIRERKDKSLEDANDYEHILSLNSN